MKTITESKREIDSLFLEIEKIKEKINNKIENDSGYLKIKEDLQNQEYRFLFFPHHLEFSFYKIWKVERKILKSQDIFTINSFGQIEYLIPETHEIKATAERIQKEVSKFYEVSENGI